MPESFIFAIVLLAIALVVLLVSPLIARKEVVVTEGSYDRKRVTERFGYGVPLLSVLALLLLAGLFTTNASFNTVPVRNVGIVTQFHTPTGGTTGSGVHWVRPWDKIEEWDANYEPWDHTGDNSGKGLLVKIAGNQDAWVPVSVEFAPDPANAPQDFKDYARNRDNWIQRRVYPTLLNSVTSLFRTHDPLAKANVDPTTKQVNPPDMMPYKNELNNQLKSEELGFKVRNLYIGTIVYNQKTTEALQQYANLVLENRNLEQQKVNQQLKNDITNKQALVDKQTFCLQIAQANGSNPGLCLLGSDNGVIVNSEPAKK